MLNAKILALVICCLLLSASSYAITPSDVDETYEKSKEYMPDLQKSIDKSKANKKRNENMKKEAEKTYKTFKEQVEPQVHKWQDRFKYDGNKLVITPEKTTEDKNNENKAKQQKYLAKDERIYIFISSSIPKHILKKYALDIDKIGDLNIQMIMRGCINGCQKLMPTATFIQNLVAPSEKEQLQVQVLIDPHLFRLYEVKTVPTIVFAKNVKVDNYDGSEGMIENLKTKPVSYSIHGDVSLLYAIEKINTKANNSALTEISKELSKTWWQNNQKTQGNSTKNKP